MPGESPLIIPKGVRFAPNDEELLGYYLYNKNLAPSSSSSWFDRYSLVKECDLYGSTEPWEIWEASKRDNQNNACSLLGDGDADLYFFTKLTKKFKTGSRNSRMIGSGTWEGETAPVEVEDSNSKTCLGWKKRFRYENDKSHEHHGRWIMIEYSLNSALLHDHNNQVAADYVLCRIRKNERKAIKSVKRKEQSHAKSPAEKTLEKGSCKGEDSSMVVALPAPEPKPILPLIPAEINAQDDGNSAKRMKIESSPGNTSDSKSSLTTDHTGSSLLIEIDQAEVGHENSNIKGNEWAERFSEELRSVLYEETHQSVVVESEITMLPNNELYSWIF